MQRIASVPKSKSANPIPPAGIFGGRGQEVQRGVGIEFVEIGPSRQHGGSGLDPLDRGRAVGGLFGDRSRIRAAARSNWP